jgi:ubiquinone/menaquinone biosynthesis C-methylase UbiE
VQLSDLIGRYERAVANLTDRLPLDEAMSSAVGGDYDLVGRVEADLLERCGLKHRHSLIDLGCGSGRLAKHLGLRMPGMGYYLGTDIVQSLLDYAATQCPPRFRFVLHKELSIPAPDSSADFVVAFSLFTHLLYEQSFAYLADAVRVLRPDGKIVFSFLEMETHWHVFEWARTRVNAPDEPLNMFMERSLIDVWARKLGLKIEAYVPMGQTAVILRS